MNGRPDPSQDAVFYFAKTVARHSRTYGLFDFLGRASLFVLVPLYARVLAPADFGALELFAVTQTVAVVVLVMGFNSGLIRYATTLEDPRERILYFRTALTTVGLIAFTVTLLLFFAAPAASRISFGDASWTGAWRLLFAIVCLDAVTHVFLALFRAEGRPLAYSWVNLVKLLTALVANVVLVGFLRRGVPGALTGTLLGSAVGAALALFLALPQAGFRLSLPALRRMAAFGVPLAVSGLGFLLMSSADRYFLKAFASLGDLGVYSLGYKVGMVMSITVNALVVAWPPILFRIAKEPNAPVIFGRVVTYYLLVTGVLAAAVGSLSHELVRVVGGAGYGDAGSIVPFILFAYLLSGLYHLLAVSAAVTDRTAWLPLIVGAGALVSLCGNLVLVPKHGILGSAWTALLAYGTIALLMGLVGRRFYAIPIEGRRLAVLGVVCGGVLAASGWIGHGGPGTLLAKIALLAAIPVLLVALGFFTSEERLRARSLLGRLAARSRGR